MNPTIIEVKEKLWDLILDMSDQEVEEVIIWSKRIVNIILDYMEKKDIDNTI